MLDRLFELTIILGVIGLYVARSAFMDEFALRISSLDDAGCGGRTSTAPSRVIPSVGTGGRVSDVPFPFVCGPSCPTLTRISLGQKVEHRALPDEKCLGREVRLMAASEYGCTGRVVQLDSVVPNGCR
jgi:hypothetical protein